MRRQPVDLVGQEAQVASGCLGGRRGAQPQKSGATTHVFADQREIARQTGLVPKPPRCPQARHPGCDLGSGSTGHEPGDDQPRLGPCVRGRARDRRRDGGQRLRQATHLWVVASAVFVAGLAGAVHNAGEAGPRPGRPSTQLVQALIDRGRTRPMLDERRAEQILGYDASGVPG